MTDKIKKIFVIPAQTGKNPSVIFEQMRKKTISEEEAKKQLEEIWSDTYSTASRKIFNTLFRIS